MEDKKIDRRGKIDFSFNEGKRIEKKDIKQVNICISFEGEKYDSKDKVYLDLSSNIIGGSMSSRLFQQIREKNGLAYSVYTYNQYYLSGGISSTYIGTNVQNYKKAIEITLNEFEKLRENGISQEELQKAKNKYLSKIAFSFENPRARMSILGNYYSRKNEILEPQKLKDEINSVKLKDINKFLKNQYIKKNITVLGNIK